MKLKKYKEICKLINEKQLQLLQKTKNTKKQTIEHPKNSIQTNKETRKKYKEKIEKKNTTINYTDPEARKSPNKEGKTQAEYNKQITVDNKNRLIIAVDATEDTSDQKTTTTHNYTKQHPKKH